jgi:solute carrier family 39 (zinc transporter), member 1/2/3
LLAVRRANFSNNHPASLVTAITFHQLFEGLSLGIRIAALPQERSCEERHLENGNGAGEPLLPQNGADHGKFDDRVGVKEGGFQVCLKPILAILFAIGTPVGIAIGLLAFVGDGDNGAYHVFLSSSFPFSDVRLRVSLTLTVSTVKLTLTQGLMSAISAGMLIYAACVEMLAGDFVMDIGLWRSGVWKQAVAVVSLAVGVVGMACVGS